MTNEQMTALREFDHHIDIAVDGVADTAMSMLQKLRLLVSKIENKELVNVTEACREVIELDDERKILLRLRNALRQIRDDVCAS